MKNDLIHPDKMSGYELAKKVLDSSGRVEDLLELSNNGESNWLELKAGMELLPEDVKRGFKPDDLYWNIATAVLEIMNTSGGVLIIGIEDKTHKVIPLRENDSLHIIEQRGMEAYRRLAILERIWPSDVKKWSQPKENKTWRIKDVVPVNLLEPRGVQYQGEEIAVVLIKPALPAIRIWKNEEVEQIRARVPGEIGKVLEIKGGKQMDLYDQNRCVETESYAALHQRFLEKNISQSDDACINEKIENYYRDFEKKISEQKVFNLSWFTPLDASGELVEEDRQKDDFMEPQARELLDEDESWLELEEREDEYDEEDEINEEKGVDDGGVIDDEKEEDGNEKNTRYREKRFGDLLQLMHDKELSRIVLLGEPGGGKTTTFKRFVMEFHQPDKSKQILAFYISMGQWQKGDNLSLLLRNMTGITSGELQKLIETNRLRLVIDAVNECPDSFRKAAVSNIQSFLLDHPDLPVAISTRTDEDLNILHLPTFTVQPMDAAHQLNYLKSYLKNPEEARSLFDQLHGRPGGMEIAANPMLLRLVVEVFKSKGKLPTGRADLYHHWIEQWYTRESGLAQKAGAPLPWRFKKALDILSELAFKSRLQGYRDVPMEIVASILERFGKNCISKLCQGPVVFADGDFIRFRHETFQEYFCAEYLVKHPVSLPRLTKDDSSQWGMPLAYAAELLWPLPEQLWRSAWMIDPWFGFAVTDDDRFKQAEEVLSYSYNPFLSHVLTNCMLRKESEQFVFSMGRFLKDINVWYSNADQELGYIVSTNETIRRRWLKIELCMLCCEESSTKAICTVLSRSIVLKQYAGHSISKTFQNIMGIKAISIPPPLIKSLQSFEKKYSHEINIPNAIQLINDGFASREDFMGHITRWLQTASIESIKELIAVGLATKEDVKNNNYERVMKADLQTAKRLIQEGFASKEDFTERIEQWIKEANPQMAIRLIQEGFASKEDFKNHFIHWIQNGAIKNIKEIIDAKIATKEDIKAYKKKLIQESDPQMAIHLIQIGFASKYDFKDKLKEWIKEVSPQMAIRLVHAGIASIDDFAVLIDDYLSGSTCQEYPRTIKDVFRSIISQRACKNISPLKTHIVCNEWRLSTAIVSKVFPYLDSQGIKHNRTDVRTWLEEWLQDPKGVYWSFSISVPRISAVYSINNTNSWTKLDDGRFMLKYYIGDCSGTIISDSPISNIFVRVTGINGTNCLGEIEQESSLETYSDLQEKKDCLTSKSVVCFSAKGVTGILDSFVNGAAYVSSIICNDGKILDLLKETPRERIISASDYPIEPIVMLRPKQRASSDYSFATDCDKCGGVGIITCGMCEGTGASKCKKCGGTGQITCKKCGGTGTSECFKCKGSGKMKCQKCKGTGTIEYWNNIDPGLSVNGFFQQLHAIRSFLNGRTDGNSEKRKCDCCNGSGVVDCKACNGTGHRECIACSGDGAVECYRCQKAKSNICNICGGTGEIECFACKGYSAFFVHYDWTNKKFYRGKKKPDGSLEGKYAGFVDKSKVYLFVEKTMTKTEICGSWDKIVSAVGLPMANVNSTNS